MARHEASAQHIIRAVQELDLAESERADLLPTALRLAHPGSPAASAEETQRLATRLAGILFPPSSVRQALQAHRARQTAFGALLGLARTQVTMLHPLFWLLSAGIVAIGAVALSGSIPLNQALFLQALGPLLAYLGASLAFRGMGLRVLECEMTCPPSLMQITLARLVIVLGYDLLLGSAMTLIISVRAHLDLAVVLAHWLTPLLLVMGLALALSQRLAITVSATLAYGAWLSLVATQLATLQNGSQAWTTSAQFELVIGIVGATLLTLTLARMRDVAPRWLPRS